MERSDCRRAAVGVLLPKFTTFLLTTIKICMYKQMIMQHGTKKAAMAEITPAINPEFTWQNWLPVVPSDVANTKRIALTRERIQTDMMAKTALWTVLNFGYLIG